MSPFYTDTSPAMEALQVQLLRAAPSWRKMEMLAGLNASARSLAMAGLRQRFPHANEPALITARVTGILEKLHVRYMIGG
jgi:hypothetical protein